MKIDSIKETLRLGLSIARVEFKLRNEGSYLGVLWYLLNPLLMFLILLLIFSDRIGTNIPRYPPFLLLGIIIFNFFQQTTTGSTKVIRDNSWLIKSIKFPHQALVVSIVFRTLFSHISEMIVFAVFLLFFRSSTVNLIFYPIILCFLSVFVLGAAFILSSLSIYFIDLDNIWAFVSRLIWLGTPIFYAIGGQTRLLYFNLFNPMFYFITISRELILYAKMPQIWMMVGAAAYSLLFLIAGLLIFNKFKIKFAEMV